ncbi:MULTISPECIES: histidine kinase dimerization/phosphoacceptor domain -containing protein [Aerosakkonema]|uniref:sensor histidine kinase n=1 Tax=Aerosakkonema TaxID=1246629 RepID=UPI0035B96C51
MNDIEELAEKFSVLDRIPIGICVLREDFTVLYWNRCLENWTNIPKQEILGTDMIERFPHLKETKYASRLKQIFAGGPPTLFSSQLHKHFIPAYLPNGQQRIQHTTVTAEPAPEGGYYALFSIQDVTELTQRVQDYRIMRDRALTEVKERQQTEKALQQAKDQLQVVLDAVPGLVSWISSDLRYMGVNRHLCTAFNRPPEIFIGQEIGFLESSKTFAEFMSYFMRGDDKSGSRVIDANINGAIRNYLIVAQKYQQGEAAVAVGIDITDQKQIEQQLKASLKEKELLLKEIHHRVKNNLQIISSLLKLQSECSNDPEIASLLSDSYNRVRSMALIHEKLYQSEGIALIDAGDYITSLANNLVRSYRLLSEFIDLDIKFEPIFFDVDTAIPCGLIINELVCNSLKYAFTNGKAGKISIKIALIEESKFLLEVYDNGIGLPPNFDLEESKSLGLQLVVNLTNQLDGDIEVHSEAGTHFKITFPFKRNDCRLPSLP